MRPLPLVVVALFVAACAPKGDDAPAADSLTDALPDSAARIDQVVPESLRADSLRGTSSPGIVVPAPAGARPSASASGAPASGTVKAANTRTDRADSTAAPRIKPPTKAPGGFIVVPRTTHDSLRMAPPATSTRP